MDEALVQARSDDSIASETSVPETETAGSPPEPRHYRRVTLNLPIELLDQLRNTVYWTPGVTLTGLIKTALCESLARMEQRHGRPYPPRMGELKSGRPRKIKGDPRLLSSFPIPESRVDSVGHGLEV
ncbi:MAG: hypothetical protein NW703_10885 [Nitrospiraceae bacterium]